MDRVAKNAWVEEACTFFSRPLVAVTAPFPKVRLEALILLLKVFQVNVMVGVGQLLYQADHTFFKRLVFFGALDCCLSHYLDLRIWAMLHVVKAWYFALCAVRVVHSQR